MRNAIIAMLMAISIAASAQENINPSGDFNFDPETQTVDALFSGTPDSITFVHAVTCNVDRATGCSVSQRLGDCVVTMALKYVPGQTVYIVCPGYSEPVTVADFSGPDEKNVAPIAIILGNDVWLLVRRKNGSVTYVDQGNLFAKP